MSEPTHAHSTDEILRAAAAWVWFPRDSEHERSELLLVRDPSRFGGGVRGSQVSSVLEPTEIVDHALEWTGAWGASRFTFWTNPSDRPDIEEELRRRGAEHIDTVAVFARPVDGAAAVDVPDDITVEVVRTLEQVRDVDAVNVPVWQQEPLDPQGLRAELAEVTTALETREGFRILARIGGRAVSTGGCTIDGGFVRLWGASTLPEYRGRGAYRAVLAERLRESSAWGATTALVKGRISTSAPILARAGFTHFGDERAYRLTLEA